MTPPVPENIQVIGDLLAIQWSDQSEDFFPMEKLRAASPSAENMGERDLTGQLHGGSGQRAFPGVTVTGWQVVGGYALLFTFSDGHRTGIYPYPYLKGLAKTIGT
ncbi:MAG: gamma-butyrobetaine hydroxylase-like domain-containing protein [Verrucomicrobiales bacterium]